MGPSGLQSPQKKLDSDPFRRRAAWWTEPGAIILFLVFVLLGTLLELYAYRLGYTNVLIIFGVFWSVVTIVVMVMYRRSQYEMSMYIDEGTLARTKKEILQHRAAGQKGFGDKQLFSLSVKKTDVPKLLSSGHIRLAELRKFSDAGFEGGGEIEPHRSLQPSAASRGK